MDALVVSTPQGDQVFTLKGAERPYRILMEKMKEGAVTLAGDDTIFYCNQGFADMLKRPLEKMIGTGISQFVSPADRPVFEKLLRQGKESGIKGETTFLARDGTAVPTHLSINAMPLDGLSSVYLVVTDLTGQKRIQNELRRARDELEIRVEKRTAELAKSEQRWATTLASIGDAVISTDAGGRITFMNTVAESLTGWTLADASTKPMTEVFNIINEYTRQQVDNPVAKVLRDGMIIGLANHTVLIRKDGTELPIDDSGAPIKDVDGRVMGVVLVFRDITERRRAEEALRESEQKYRSIVETANEGIWIVDMERKTTYVNPKMAEMLGYEAHEMIGKSGLDFLDEEGLALSNLNIEKRKLGINDSYEYKLIRRDGSPLWTIVNAKPLFDTEGRFTGTMSMLTDITKRKQAEQELFETQQRLQALLQALPVGVSFSDDPTCQRITGNPAALAQFEMTPEDNLSASAPNGNAPGRRVRYFRDGREISDTELPLQRAVAGNKAIPPIELEIELPSGRHWFAETSGSPIRDSQGNVTGGVTVTVDITERKLAEEALRKAHDELESRVRERTAELEEANKALLEREASYRELTESIDDLFYAMDRDLRYTYWNKASEVLTGILAKDAIGKSIYELFPDVKGTKVEQFYIEALKTQQPERFETEYKLGGKKFIFEISVYPTDNGLSVIIKDITDKRNLEAQLLRAQRMESIGTLAGGIAHDLNNVLTPIMLSLHMLKEKFKDEQSQKLLTVLEKNSQRGANLIKQVLSFARGVEGEHKPLQIAQLISEIEKVAKETFPRNIEIRTDVSRDLFTVSGDATQLHQVLMNLCVNARDAMPDGGILDITALNFFIDENYARMHTEAKIGSYVTIAVSDTGIGIPQDILYRIFEPFFTTKEFGKGTGLGLSTALAIVKSHGGFINVYSEAGKGTTFVVYLPSIKTELQKVKEEQIELLVGQGELVLVAEDEDSIREVTVSILKEYGYNVLIANDGADAVALYAQNKDKIKVVLMDMMMPVMDGHMSIRAIRKINPQVKIIAVSGLAEKDKLKDVVETTDAFLPKPYTAERLLKTIHEVLDGK